MIEPYPPSSQSHINLFPNKVRLTSGSKWMTSSILFYQIASENDSDEWFQLDHCPSRNTFDYSKQSRAPQYSRQMSLGVRAQMALRFDPASVTWPQVVEAGDRGLRGPVSSAVNQSQLTKKGMEICKIDQGCIFSNRTFRWQGQSLWSKQFSVGLYERCLAGCCLIDTQLLVLIRLCLESTELNKRMIIAKYSALNRLHRSAVAHWNLHKITDILQMTFWHAFCGIRQNKLAYFD